MKEQKAYAMECTEEQFEQLRPRLEKIEGVSIQNITPDWGAMIYLTNNFMLRYGKVSNISSVNYDPTRTIIPFNPDLFCESLGEVKKQKAFPEKWAVRANGMNGKGLFNDFLDRNNYDFNRGVLVGCDANSVYYLENNMLRVATNRYDVTPDGYTEVTLEDLIAHYEPKKDTFRVRVIKAEPHNWYKVGEEHTITLGESGNVYHVDLNRAIYKWNCEIITEPTHPKWMPLTRGGYEYKIAMEDRGDITYPIIIIVKDGSVWFPATINEKGLFDRDGQSSYDLIRYNPRISELEEKITSKRSELAELEGELKELKK